MLSALFQHRTLIASLVRQEFQLRSARASWGLGWLVIEPAIQIAIYTIIFGAVLSARLPGDNPPFAYGLYVCTGLLTWNLFTQIVTRGLNLFLEHATLIQTLQFPRSALPLALVIVSTIQFAIGMTLFLLVLWGLGHLHPIPILATLPALAIQTTLALGLAIICGTLHVFFRDVGYATSVILQFWFWLTPIVYPLEIVPEPARTFIAANPLTPLFQIYQRAVLKGAMPDVLILPVPLVIALATILGAWLLFRTVSAEIVDEL